MQTIRELGLAIDAATENGDEGKLRQLGEECERGLASAVGEDRVTLRYYQANTFSAIMEAKQANPEYIWNWQNPDAIQNILLLRQAIGEDAFGQIHPLIAYQIRTNLANRLHSLGRPVAAYEQRFKVLKTAPRFAKALAGQAQGLADLARTVYDQGHIPHLLAAARSLYDSALHEDAIWESGDRASFAPHLKKQREDIAIALELNGYDENFDRNQWSLGSTKEERSYRRWCLRERLFLNPLNEAYMDSVAATDVLHLPSHSYKFPESPRFPAYFNLMKQEFVSARYRLYQATQGIAPKFVMRGVLMLDSGEGQVLGHLTEELRSAFRAAYAIFDKIGLFLNDYYQIGINARNVTFRGVWSKKPNSAVFALRPMFEGNRNWMLRGLYFVSSDLFDEAFKGVSEPDAANLAMLRQQIEHRFLSFQDYQNGEGTETHRLISIGEFQRKALRLLKLAREALIYVSLAMHREEAIRREASQSNRENLEVPVLSPRIVEFDQSG